MRPWRLWNNADDFEANPNTLLNHRGEGFSVIVNHFIQMKKRRNKFTFPKNYKGDITPRINW